MCTSHGHFLLRGVIVDSLDTTHSSYPASRLPPRLFSTFIMSHSTPEEQRFWANLLVPAISRLLDHAGTYSNEEMEAQVGFVQHHATAWLGRTRQTRSAKDGAETPLTVNSALETSLNFSAEGNTMVRFQFEPMTAQRWVEGDSFGRNATYVNARRLIFGG